MKHLLTLLAGVFILGIISCQKETIIEKETVGVPIEMQLTAKEKVIATYAESTSSDWVIAARYSYNVNYIRIWKLVNADNQVVIINPVPADLYWQNDMYKGAQIADGLVKSLLFTQTGSYKE